MIPTHALVGLVITDVVAGPRTTWALRAAGGLCAALPDADVLLMRYADVGYGEAWGHRGLTHSIFFAVVLGLAVALAFLRRGPLPWGRVAIALAFATASHGVLDALTAGGHGVAFFAPFSPERHDLPWYPIPVAPLSVRGFFTAHGQRVFGWELLHLWLPLTLLLVLLHAMRRATRRPSA